MEHSEIRVEARLDNLYTLLEFVAACARRHGAGEQRLREIDLVMEELLVNIFNYAYPGRSGDVTVTCGSDENGRMVVEIADAGVPFNILTRDDPDRDAGIEERTVGGLGIYLVKRLVREISYRREGELNILTLRIDSAPAAI